ncbi:hypothetical protein TCDM_04518 [Trypanosoma cruzi Dm28c]|uniref:Uncharacterized protein n=1 Tax=Trypanosoma cruzi Dm28c TaxID=1416333 RepID=V5DHE2_TRYCR|nr:hypothetical protein TCDM_04518 [Trypanosoma cruzi Dm28c]KAF8283832.1 hypothetical protein TcBrA4_0058120 [Trypanosoma cruzi]
MSDHYENASEANSLSPLLQTPLLSTRQYFISPRRQNQQQVPTDGIWSLFPWFLGPCGDSNVSARAQRNRSLPASDGGENSHRVLPSLELANGMDNGNEVKHRQQQIHPSSLSFSLAGFGSQFDDMQPLVTLLRSSTTSTLGNSEEYRSTPIRRLRRCVSPVRFFHFPTKNFLPQTRRQAAIKIVRWWRSREALSEKRRIHALKLIQRVGRGYLCLKQLSRPVEVTRDSSSFARSIRLCSSISMWLNKLGEKSITRIPADKLGVVLCETRGQFNPGQSYCSRCCRNTSGSTSRNYVSFRGLGKGVRGARLVNFDPENNTASAQAEESKNAVSSDANNLSGSFINENADFIYSPALSHNEGADIFYLPRISQRTHANKENEETQPQNEAFFCTFNNRVSLEPFSVKVARSLRSRDYNELGPWSLQSARRSTVERVCPNASML